MSGPCREWESSPKDRRLATSLDAAPLPVAMLTAMALCYDSSCRVEFGLQ